MATLLIACVASAQEYGIGGPLRLQPIPQESALSKSMFSAPRHASPQHRTIEVDGERQMWWGYYQSESRIVGLGTSEAETYWVGMGVPVSQDICQDKVIKAVRFMVAGSQFMKDFSLWISEALPGDGPSNYMKIPVDMSLIKDNKMIEVELPEPYTVPTRKFYVGYTFTITQANEVSNFPVLINYDGTNTPEAILIRTTSKIPDWTDPADTESGYGELVLQVLLDGDFDHNAVSANSSFIDVYSLVGGTGNAQITLTSRGLGKVENIDYTETTPEGTSEERHLDLVPFEGMGAQRVVNITLTADAQSGRTQRTIKIHKVNGVPNENGVAVSKGYIVSLTQAAKKKVLVEEFTGTWCGWCPRGIVGLNKLNEKYPDEVVTVAIHNDDPMAIQYGIEAPSFPYAFVNRTTPADPYLGINGAPFGIGDLVAEQLQIPAEASIALSEPQMDVNGKITFSTDLVFNYSSDTAPYALAFAVLTDGLTGDTKKWAQANYYSHAADWAGYADLKEWYEGASYMKQVYNHVAIAGKGIANGLTGSVKAPIVEGETKTYSNYINVSGNALTTNLDQLSVVAMLINKTTGAVVNADKRAVKVVDNFPVNSATIGAFDMATAVLGGTTTVSVPMKSVGRAGVKSIDYTVRAGANESELMHVELAEPIKGIGVSRYVDFQIPADTITGIVTRSVLLKKVNGEENESKQSTSASGKLMTIAKESPRKTVIEEYTGTWCMWCCRGIAGLKRAHDEYPNDIVLMAIHSGSGNSSDPMQNSVFNTVISGHNFPSADVNRYRPVDPYIGEGTEGWGLGKVIEDEQKKLAEAGVNLSTPILDEATGVINFTTDVTFQINRRNAPYLLSYVLIGDGLTGTTSDWTQVNAYSIYAGSYDDDPYMKEITEWPIYVEGLVYDHVALNALGIASGLTGSLKNRVEEGQVQSHSTQFNIKNQTLAKKATKLYVAAMVYDRDRKCFINADVKEVVSSTVGINTTDMKAGELVEVARFTADGKRISHAQKGLNIVRMSDGTVRKVMVR